MCTEYQVVATCRERSRAVIPNFVAAHCTPKSEHLERRRRIEGPAKRRRARVGDAVGGEVHLPQSPRSSGDPGIG